MQLLHLRLNETYVNGEITTTFWLNLKEDRKEYTISNVRNKYLYYSVCLSPVTFYAICEATFMSSTLTKPEEQKA